MRCQRTSGILGSEGQVVGLRVEGSTVRRKGLLGSNMGILEWRVEWFDLRYTEAILRIRAQRWSVLVVS